ncbi:MAG: 4Fe-4S dicluster domain-containing protein [Eubacteriales bacterium]|nr:4Fe-4S dicluster domain-containing protein [Lachnospiraceae bacterium]MDO5128169.1 4Fe-4S dicluster domain-containing protein [Eubacteriales bacterium]
MRKFDTRIQYLRYKVLCETAKLAWEGQLAEGILDIPKTIIPGPKPTMRCCIYKERAIVGERVKLAMGGDASNDNVIEVLEIACAECPVGGYQVSQNCMGCLAHRCADACKFGAITIDEHQKAHIDKSKCKECGACAKVCPYSAINDFKRPCQQACKVGAISMNEDQAAKIDNDKCISCGACVYQCPFGAINEKSNILEVIRLLKGDADGKKHKIYAAVAPAIASQFIYAKPGQALQGIKALGFDEVVEVALGADITTWEETRELAEKGLMTSSCCPAFVAYIAKSFPDMLPYVSSTLSPMAMIGKHIKESDPLAKVVFIGPCTAKKMEIKRETVAPYVDTAITFEELQALLDSRNIDITTLEPLSVEDASYFGRIFARSGGLSEAVSQGIKEQDLTDVNYTPVVCNGIEECKIALLKLRKNLLDGNFIEGMACQGGCVNGNGCLTHMAKSRMDVENYGRAASTPDIRHAIKQANVKEGEE